MDKTLKVINEMKKEGVIKDYAIGGSIGTIFYTEPFFCEYLDILFIPSECYNATKSPFYINKYLRGKGYKPNKEYCWIEGVPVKFHPVSNDLEREAVNEASRKKYRSIITRVCKPEHLIAMFVHSDGYGDLTRVAFLSQQSKIDNNLLSKILQYYNLYEKYQKKFAE